MTDDEILSMAHESGLIDFRDALHVDYVQEIVEKLRLFAELVAAAATDKRVKVKLGTQYGDALAGNRFYLQPADDYADQALFQHTGVDHDAP